MSTFKPSIRSIFVCMLLIACAVFIIVQRDNMRYSVSYLNDEKVPKLSQTARKAHKKELDQTQNLQNDMLRYQLRWSPDNEGKVDLKKSPIVTQTFTAQDRLLKKVTISFNNPQNYTATGQVIVTVKDTAGKKICSSTIDANLIRNNVRTIFDFTRDNTIANANKIVNRKIQVPNQTGYPLTTGETYTLEVEAKNVHTDDAFAINLCEESYQDGETLFAGTKNLGGKRIFGAVIYLHQPLALMGIMLFGLLLVLLLALCTPILNRVRQPRLNLLLSRIMLIATPFFLYWLTTKLAGLKTTHIVRSLFTFDGFLNLLILILACLVLYVICNRAKYTIIIITCVGIVFCLANFLLMQFRGSPLIATDIASAGTAMDVMANYTVVFTKKIFLIITASVIWICLAILLNAYKGLSGKSRVAAVLVAAIGVSGFYYTFFVSDFLERNNIIVSGFKPQWSYKKHGYVLSFAITCTTARIEKPHGYSANEVKEITAKYRSDEALTGTTVSKEHPNIIAIMNEAFSDLQDVGEFKTSAPYLPFFNSLKEDTVRGTMHPSIFGGSTANTEFEFLTGNTVAFMPFHSVPYNNNIKIASPSLTRTLMAQGYGGNVAFHPGAADSYNRTVVYENLGFEKSIFLEDLKDPEYLRAYVSDASDYAVVQEQYEAYRKQDSKKPFFLFNVTIQNHSDFKLSSGFVDRQIEITDDEVEEEQAEQYLNLIKKSDEAFEELVNYYQNIEEPTIIVMFGDHQPRVGNSFYSLLNSRNDADNELTQEERKYQVPFLIWANYDIEEEQNVQISANFLGPFLLDRIGAQMTGYDKFLLDLYDQVPVLSAICYMDREGNLYAPGEESSFSKLIENYKKIQYNYIVDTHHRVDDFFYLNSRATK